mgnify:CR=1 FL=1
MVVLVKKAERIAQITRCIVVNALNDEMLPHNSLGHDRGGTSRRHGADPDAPSADTRRLQPHLHGIDAAAHLEDDIRATA